MGVCRGSGILEKTPKGWQIQQYHLSVTVPNDLVRDFITLVANFEKDKK
ncbi:MAG TPA: nuclear transport factor 2 family protein [Cyclobacteriaceae bacterium]|nr:nuclear transport factor 2 family protein [Cyclobacteriaceae bacterium]